MRSALVLVALLVAGCAPMQWVKEGAAPEQADADALQCQQDARREAR